MTTPSEFRKRRFSDSHVPPKLRSQVYDILNAVAHCLSQEPRLAIPALMLIYAGIDGMAYVTLPEGQADVRQLVVQHGGTTLDDGYWEQLSDKP